MEPIDVTDQVLKTSDPQFLVDAREFLLKHPSQALCAFRQDFLEVLGAGHRQDHASKKKEKEKENGNGNDEAGKDGVTTSMGTRNKQQCQVWQDQCTLASLFADHEMLAMMIISQLSITDLVRLMKVSRLFRDFAKRNVWNIDTRLIRFAPKPKELREALKLSNAVISGEFALEFFRRSPHLTNSLDVYVVVHDSTESHFESYLKNQVGYQPRVDAKLVATNDTYWTNSLERHTPTYGTTYVNVNRIGNAVLEVLFNRISFTSLLNVIAHNKAYCAYPKATLMQGMMLPTVSFPDRDDERPQLLALERHGLCVEHIAVDLRLEKHLEVYNNEEFLPVWRSLSDRHAFVLQFDGFLSQSNERSRDAFEISVEYSTFLLMREISCYEDIPPNWQLGRPDSLCQFHTEPFRHPLLRFEYTSALSNDERWDQLREVLNRWLYWQTLRVEPAHGAQGGLTNPPSNESTRDNLSYLLLGDAWPEHDRPDDWRYLDHLVPDILKNFGCRPPCQPRIVPPCLFESDSDSDSDSDAEQ